MIVLLLHYRHTISTDYSDISTLSVPDISVTIIGTGHRVRLSVNYRHTNGTNYYRYTIITVSVLISDRYRYWYWHNIRTPSVHHRFAIGTLSVHFQYTIENYLYWFRHTIGKLSKYHQYTFCSGFSCTDSVTETIGTTVIADIGTLLVHHWYTSSVSDVCTDYRGTLSVLISVSNRSTSRYIIRMVHRNWYRYTIGANIGRLLVPDIAIYCIGIRYRYSNLTLSARTIGTLSVALFGTLSLVHGYW